MRFLKNSTMTTPHFFRARLDGMVDLRHPLVVLARWLPWAHIEPVLAPHFQRRRARMGWPLFATCWVSTRRSSVLA